MRILRPIVEPTADLVPLGGNADIVRRRLIGPKAIGDDRPRSAVFLHDALQKLERCGLVPLRRDHCFQNLTFVIDRPPQVADLPLIFTKASSKCHVWMPPLAQDGFEWFGRVIGCGHVSGLQARPITTAGRYGDARTRRKINAASF